MFYSHTFLARKGPLGTVWCAAHLQHKLKKSHYTSTDISSTVERIMHPEVPIALRMSGHLLLGIVRIYSKQVDYLHHDCNAALVVIRKACISSNVDQPEDATHAPFDVVIRPETCNLDAVELEDDVNQERSEDHHLKQLEDITLEDPIPTGADPYIVSMDLHTATDPNEDNRKSSAVMEDASEAGSRPMEEDAQPLIPVEGTANLGVPSSSNQAGLDEKNVGDKSPRDLPEIEIMRDAVHDSHVDNNSIWPDQRDDVMEPDTVLEEQIMKDNETTFPHVREILASGGPSSSNQAGLNEKNVGDKSPRDLPEIEIMRDAVHDSHVDNNRIWPDQRDDVMEPDTVLEEQIMKDREASSPHVGEILASGGPTLRAHQPLDPSSVASEQGQENLDLHVSLGHGSAELAIRSTPPVEQPRVRQRKRRRQFYDEITVLNNRSMKRALEDPSNLLRKKRNCPSTNLEIWQLNNRLKKDSIFVKPLITGLSSELQSIYDPQFISSKPHLISSDNIRQYADPKTPLRGDNLEMEVEHLRNNEAPDVDNVMSVILPSPHQPASSPTMIIPSPSQGDKSPPGTLDFGSPSGQGGTTAHTEVRPTTEFTSSGGLFSSDMETPATHSPERLGFENTGLSDIPELLNSAGDLNFLEQDDNTPAGSPQGTPESGHMTRKQRGTTDAFSARTRAVAQYLKRQSSETPNSEQSSGDLSLNSILENKSRKICARMFFETLVLKDCGLVDIHQEEPYDDIKLRVTPKLWKEQFSS